MVFFQLQIIAAAQFDNDVFLILEEIENDVLVRKLQHNLRRRFIYIFVVNDVCDTVADVIEQVVIAVDI